MVKGFSRIADARAKMREVTTDGSLAVLTAGGYVAVGSLIVDNAGRRDRTVYGAEGTSALLSEVSVVDLPAEQVAARPDLRARFGLAD